MAQSRAKCHLARQGISLACLVVSVIVLIARTLHLNGPDVVIDDAYISFRYADNLAHGLGLVFNPGERVEGYTNFLWTAVLSGSTRLGLDIAVTAKALAMASAICTLLLLYRFSTTLAVRHQRPWIIVALPAMLFAVTPSQARYVVSGMETLFFTFLISLASYLFFRHRPLASGLAFGFAAATRPEGLMYFALAAAFAAFLPTEDAPRGRRESLILFMGAFALICGPYFLWRFSYYGYLLPNTYYAKAAGFSLARVGTGWHNLRWIAGEGGLLPIAVAGLFSWPALKSRPIWLLFAGFAAATATYFVFVGGDFVVWFGPRFFLPVLPFLLLMAAEGIWHLTSFVKRHWRSVLLCLLSLALLANSLWFAWPARFTRLEPFQAQMRSWKELAIWMETNLPPSSIIATDAAGLIPYYSRLYSIDMFGLADEHIGHLDLPTPGKGTVGHEKFDPEYILQRRPDCIVSTWMDKEGHAISAGLRSVTREFDALYQLMAVAKVRYGPPVDGKWVLTTSVYSSVLFESGYQTGLFCLKTE